MIIRNVAFVIASFITMTTTWMSGEMPANNPSSVQIVIKKCINATDSTVATSNACDEWQQEAVATKEEKE